jgi:hypothetical protein
MFMRVEYFKIFKPLILQAYFKFCDKTKGDQAHSENVLGPLSSLKLKMSAVGGGLMSGRSNYICNLGWGVVVGVLQINQGIENRCPDLSAFLSQLILFIAMCYMNPELEME